METVRPAGHHLTRTTTSDHRRRLATVFRLLLLGVLVFTIAAMAGAALAGGPAGSYERADRVTTGRPPLAGAAQPEAGATSERRVPRRPTADARFARSLVYSGATALALSLAGLVIVGRRRRRW